MSPRNQQKARALGLTSATGLVIGSIIGTGVFTMPAVLAGAGTSSLLVLAVIAIGAMVLAILFGQLTRRVPNSDGGLYAYARYEFGDVARAAASDGLFPKPFAWTDRKDTAWFGILVAAALPSLLMLWSYTTATGLTVFTELVNLTVVTVAIPYLFSACAQLTYLVSKRRRVQGWLLARDLVISGASVLFSMWVTFAAGYAAVYEALVAVLIGVIFYAFLKAWRERDGQVAAPVEASPIEGSPIEASPGTRGAAR